MPGDLQLIFTGNSWKFFDFPGVSRIEGSFPGVSRISGPGYKKEERSLEIEAFHGFINAFEYLENGGKFRDLH